MTRADLLLVNDIRNIFANGTKDENPRPKYEDGTPVVLDNYEVIEVATGKVRDVPNWGEEFHTYTIASDLDREEFAGKEIELQLVGKIGEKIVVTENYVVSANCCHIYLVKGDKEVVVKDKELK